MSLTSNKSATVWLTGLSASGKTTLANALCQKLKGLGQQAVALDGDVLRRSLSSDLGFSEADRNEHNRRVGALACVLNEQGVYAVASLISPYASSRESVRRMHKEQGLQFIEIYVATPLEVCIKRDPKGLYAKAITGEIKEFTGISAPYEAPKNPEILIETLECLNDTHKAIEIILKRLDLI